MFSIDMCKALTEAEEGQHCQDHDNQADEIDKTVHGFLHMSRAILDRQSSGIGKVPETGRKKLQPTILNHWIKSLTRCLYLPVSLPISGACLHY
jgi:hypothetical protein